MSNNNCNICTEKISKSVECGFCHFSSCRTCCETYILTTEEPKCMSPECAKPWSRTFLTTNFTQSFLQKKYKEHKEHLFFEKELALLPATQVVVERIVEKRRLEEDRAKYQQQRKQVTEIHECQYSVIQHMDLSLNRDRMIKPLGIMTREERKVIEGIVQRLKMENQPVKSELRRLTKIIDEHSIWMENVENGVHTSKKRFLRRCGDSEECRGFIDASWQCGTCTKTTCKECHRIQTPDDPNHTCDPNDVATAKLLDQDSKPCPKCATLIFKIDGCDQMWCTMCHTAFSWRTGSVETRIHNPHYFEWVRLHGEAQPRNPNDIECGRELDGRLLAEIYQLMRNRHQDQEYQKQVGLIIGTAIHIHQVEMPKYQVDQALNNEKLRIQYMMNKIDEPKFKTLVQREHVRFEKNREIHQILYMYSQCITDIMFRLQDELKQSRSPNTLRAVQQLLQLPKTNLYRIQEATNIVKTHITEVDTLVSFTNQLLSQVSKDFNSVELQIVLKKDAAFNEVLTNKNKKLRKPKTQQKQQQQQPQQVIDLLD